MVELSARLQLESTKTALKGEEYSVGAAHKKLTRTYKWNYWEYRWTRSEERFIGELVEEFMANTIEPRKEILRGVIATCSAELSIVQYYYSGCNPGIHLSHRTLDTLSYIGAEVDIDIYCLDEDA